MWMSLYILIWPALTLGVLVLLVGAIVRDVRRARAKGHEMI